VAAHADAVSTACAKRVRRQLGRAPVARGIFERAACKGADARWPAQRWRAASLSAAAPHRVEL